MVYFVLQPIRWVNTIVQYKIVQNCPVLRRLAIFKINAFVTFVNVLINVT